MKFSSILIATGYGAVATGTILLIVTFYPVIKNELDYQLHARSNTTTANAPRKSLQSTEIVPADSQFSLIIPKIGANAKVIPNVDPFNSWEYQTALTQGIAHAKGTALPDEDGNIFLFSHSSVNFYQALRYNAIFYLLNKLQPGDEIDIVYQDKRYTYQVNQSQKVSPSQVTYLDKFSSQPTLTLMTCWPPGTTFKRLIVTAKRTAPQPK